MNVVLALVFLIIISFAGKYILDNLSIKRLEYSFLNFSGFYYLLLGVIAGPQTLNLFTKDVLLRIDYVFNLIIGWTGFLIGLQLNVKNIRRFPGSLYLKSAFHFFLNFGLNVALLLFVNNMYFKDLGLLEILLMGLIVSMTSILSVGLLVRAKVLPGSRSYFFEFLAAFDNVIGVFVLGVLFIIYHLSKHNSLTAFAFMFGSYLIVLLMAFVYKQLNNEMRAFEEKGLVVLSMVLIVVAVARFFENSVLFLTMLLGAFLVNIKGLDVKKLYLTVQHWEKPLNFILFFFVGVFLRFDLGRLWYLLIVFLAISLISKSISLRALNRSMAQKGERVFLTFGVSSLSFVILLEAYLTNHSTLMLKLLTIVVIMFYFSNLLVLKQKRAN